MRKNKRFTVFITGSRGHWRACFKIDQQTFYVCDLETKTEALWYTRVLRHAFDKLKFNDYKNVSI